MKKKKLKSILKLLTPPALLGLLYELKALAAYQKFRLLLKKNKELKDIHKGKRCFIIGSGPSIKEQNLKLLKNEIVIPVNNFYVHHDFQEIMNGDCPKYYLTAPTHSPQDRETWAQWLTEISTYVPSHTKMIFGINKYVDNIESIIREYGIFQNHEIYWYFPGTNRYIEKYGFYKRYLDISRVVMEAGTASIYALIFAVYMGFEEIYLIGLDHSYICSNLNASKLRFYDNAIHQKYEKLPSNMDMFFDQGNIFFHYQTIKSNCQSKIFNLSHRTLLDVFENCTFEEIL